MKLVQLILSTLVCVYTVCVNMPLQFISPIQLSPECLNTARNCASVMRYTKCNQLDTTQQQCNIKSKCIDKEYDQLYDLACRGEAFLDSASSQIDLMCARRLDHPDCSLGILHMNIFDFGNYSQQTTLCNNAHSSFTEKCIADGISTDAMYYCTPEEYSNFITAVCSTNGASQAEDFYGTTSISTRIFILCALIPTVT